ncbi:hypothetical protein BUALT_Bualt15G0053900 [Buddleja alternifolia]|uniref:Inositol-tetrakisphosphate 1-kinase n=1 Tax=Buddleja alternifolia TaxID=168488 RepID=A0AAV6WJC8_9LAMI|nr:hypothetical protein BUALT_Bualt15G0053900 [Buddleja alternifolia]
MKLSGAISHSRADGEKEEAEEARVGVPPAVAKIVVGYALTSKKKKSFLQAKFIRLASNKGIEFVAVDLKRPLSEQGPFDIVIHKRVHPEVIVLDPPDAIEHLRNRQSMLEEVADLKLPDCYGRVCIPRQLVISNNPTSIPDEVTKAGLKVPLVVKPLVVDGSAKSHELFLAYDQCSLAKLETPMVLQEFVNHGGILFKVYIVGESIKVVRRFSLPDVTQCDLSKISGVFRFPRVSSSAASAEGANLDPTIAELPPRPLLEGLARELRLRLGLRLFNVDVIRQNGTKDLYYVIDINYFPGFGKMPEYEHIFTDFFLDLVQSKYKQ